MNHRVLLILLLFLATGLPAQTTAAPSAPPAAYQPKFKGDKANSQAEFTTLAYMRTVATSERLYYRKYHRYADSLRALVGSGSFTRRMADPDRGDYRVSYRGQQDSYALTLVPRQFDSAHRSFFLDQTGEFRVSETTSANEKSPPLK
jgi:hypothetical protein